MNEMKENKDWMHYVLCMAKHKCLEKMEEMNKEDTDHLSDSDFHVYKNCAKAIYYLMSIEKASETK